MTKQCSDCLEVKPLTDFHPNPMGKLGRRSNCKACFNARRKAQYYAAIDNQRKIKAEQAKKYRAARKANGEISRDYRKWASLKSDLVDRVQAILERCNKHRAETLCYQIMTSGQDKWIRFSMSFEGDELLAEYSGV